MRGCGEDILCEVLLTGAHCGNTAAAAALCAVNRGRLALDIAEVGEGIGAVLLLDEVLNVDLIGHIFDACVALVAVFLLDLLQFLLDNGKNIRITREDLLKARNAALKVLVLVVDLLLLQTGQAAQTHIHDGLRLRLVEVELEVLRAVHDAEQRNLVDPERLRHQVFLGFGLVLGGTDDCDNAVDKFLFFVTRQGIAKRIVLSDLQNIRRAGLRALNLNEDDALVDVRLTDGEQNILIATHEGKAICFDENEVRAMGRVATGVRGIKLAEGDYVIGAARARKDAYVLSITENGYGKRTPVEEFTVHHRGGGGMMLHNLTEKTGLVAGIAVVDSENDVMIITDDGVIIRTGVEEIRECGRGSQGVIVMRTGEDVKVISIARTDKEEEDPAEAEEETSESAENAESTEE